MKPHVICHMLSAIDGRLLLDRWAPEGSDLLRAVHAEYQRSHHGFEADAGSAARRRWRISRLELRSAQAGASGTVHLRYGVSMKSR